EDHGGGRDYGSPDQHRLGGGLERITSSVVLFQHVLGAFKLHVKAVVLFDLLLHIRYLLDQRELVNGLGVISYGTIGIHSDRYRPHAQEAESDQAKGEDRGGQHEGSVGPGQIRAQTHGAEVEGNAHQGDDADSHPVGGEIASDQAGKNVKRRSALVRGGNDFLYVARVHRGEDLHQFGDNGARQRAARDDAGQLPPQGGIARQIGDNQP